MNSQNYTFGLLKKRVLLALEEYSSEDSTYYSDTERDRLDKGMATAVNAALTRMYESLPMEKKSADVYVFAPNIIGFAPKLDGSDGDSLSFAPTERIQVFFTVYGTGKAVFISENGNEVFSKSFEEKNGTFEAVRFSVAADEAVAKVATEGDIHLRDVCVYTSAEIQQDDMIPPYGFCTFRLPEDFGQLCKAASNGRNIRAESIVTAGKLGYIKRSDFDEKSCDRIGITYQPSAPIINDGTEDSFILSMTPVLFEALVNLSASELCCENSPGMYTRLVYKYNDLAESCFSVKNVSSVSRNGFYKSGKRRW